MKATLSYFIANMVHIYLKYSNPTIYLMVYRNLVRSTIYNNRLYNIRPHVKRSVQLITFLIY